MSWQRPNIGSRVNREIHARFWERVEVKFLRATRQKRKPEDTQSVSILNERGRLSREQHFAEKKNCSGSLIYIK